MFLSKMRRNKEKFALVKIEQEGQARNSLCLSPSQRLNYMSKKAIAIRCS